MKMKKLLGIPLILILLVVAADAMAQIEAPHEQESQRGRFVPERLILQHSANAGLAAIGLGYGGQTFAFDILYGFTPKSEAGLTVQQVNLKGLWHVFAAGIHNHFKLAPYLGLAVYYSPSSELFVKTPSQYPEEGYYPATAFRPALLAGIELRNDSDIGIGIECSLLDSEITYVRDNGGRSYTKIASLGIVFRYTLP